MIEITFKDFYHYNFDDDELYELYIVKDETENALYIGISTQNIWNRWFGWNGHIIRDAKAMIAQSTVGKKIVNHLPDSWDWKIQLWTFDDCMALLKDKLNPQGKYTIGSVEPFMIQKFRPSLNVIYNVNPGKDTLVESHKEREHQKLLDEVYRNIFEKKQDG